MNSKFLFSDYFNKFLSEKMRTDWISNLTWKKVGWNNHQIRREYIYSLIFTARQCVVQQKFSVLSWLVCASGSINNIFIFMNCLPNEMCV